MDKPKEDKVLTREQQVKVFIAEYQALCEKHNCQIIVTPAWKVSQDTGTWSTVLQSSIGEMPSKEKQ